MRSLLVTLLLLASCAATPAREALSLRGEWIQGGVILGQVEPAAKVSFKGRSLRISDQGLFVLGLDRDEPSEVQLHVQLPGSKEQTLHYAVKKREYLVQRVEGLPPAMVTPPPEALARIAEDIRLAQAARERDSARADFAKGFIWPLIGPVTGVFGSQRILNGQPRQPHYGVDVVAPVGTPVRAPASGMVSLAVPDMYYTGGTLMIDHGHGLSSAFLHLSKILVKEGQEVQQGQVIAEVGATGRVTGAHLDWRVNWFDSRVDAQMLVGPMPVPSKE